MWFFAIYIYIYYYYFYEENKGSVSDRLGMCIIFCVNLYLYCKAVTSLKLVRKKKNNPKAFWTTVHARTLWNPREQTSLEKEFDFSYL